MSRPPRRSAGNRLLDALPRRGREQLLAQSELTQLSPSQVLLEPEQRISHVFFPVTSYISITNPGTAKGSLETRLVGNEGMLGTPLLLGVDLSPKRALVQGAGSAWRMRSAPFRRELERSDARRAPSRCDRCCRSAERA